MADDQKGLLARWAQGLWVIAVIVSVLWIYSLLKVKSQVPGQRLSIWPSIVPVALIWATCLFGFIGFRATSSILAAIVSMIYAFAGVLLLFTPSPYRFFGLLPVFFSVYLYLFSTTTWAIHERYWLKESISKAQIGRPN